MANVCRLAQFARFPLPLLGSFLKVDSPILRNQLCGIDFSNPVGLAAGFDKNARLVDFMAALGFGFVEVGSVTNQPTVGNPKPRLFRLEAERALINRLGLNNLGPDVIRNNILARNSLIPLAVNIAKTNDMRILEGEAIEDFSSCYRRMSDCGDFDVLNISCPNTADGRTFEDSSGLSLLLSAIENETKKFTVKKPLFVKFSSDIEFAELESAIETAEKFNVAGYVLTNTSKSRDNLVSETSKLGAGGLSGPPIFLKALERVRFVSKLLRGKKVIIGVGGINSAETAYQMIRAGASLLELYTGLVYEGPAICRRINQGLVECLEQDGFLSLKQAVGTS